MRLALITAPAETPISIEEAKDHLRDVPDADDDQVTAMIAAATAGLDGRSGSLGRALCTQTWQTFLDRFPCDSEDILLPLPPLRSVTSVTYVDSNGDIQTLATTVYGVDTSSEPAAIFLKYGQSWPATRRERKAITIQFEAGYGAAADVPAPIKSAILLMVGDLYANREAQGEPLTKNPAVERLLFPYKVFGP